MIEELGRFAIFHGLAAEELQAVAKLCRPAQVKRGERIFQAGERANSLFLVLAGKVELRFGVTYHNATAEIPLESLAGGEVFGWSAVTPPYEYTLTAYAQEDSELLQLDHGELQRLCEVNVHLGHTFMKNTARIIGRRFQAAQQMLVKEIQDRLKHQDALA